MTIKIYEYAGCSTCRKALKYLDGRKKKYERVPIVEQPPTVIFTLRLRRWLLLRSC